MQFVSKSVSKNELNDVIDFDNQYLMNALTELGISKEHLPPSLTLHDLDQALSRKDALNWIFVDNNVAGYYWFELKPSHLYISGLAIKPNFQGMGLIQWILRLADEKAKEHTLNSCRLIVIPLNGRAVSAYLKDGYQIIQCALASHFGAEYPDSYRFIMEKNLLSKEPGTATDSREVICTEYEKMKDLTDQGYVGIQLIRSPNQNDNENKIVFKKFI